MPENLSLEQNRTMLRHDYLHALKQNEQKGEPEVLKIPLTLAFWKLTKMNGDDEEAKTYEILANDLLRKQFENKPKEYCEQFEEAANQSANKFVENYKFQLLARAIYQMRLDQPEITDAQILEETKVNPEVLVEVDKIIKKFEQKQKQNETAAE